MLLPSGFRSIHALAESSIAGAAYITGRTLPHMHDYGDTPATQAAADAIYPPVRTVHGPHPDCWIAEYLDGSIWIHSNADDEVWYAASAYLNECDCASLEEALGSPNPPAGMPTGSTR